MLLPTRRPTGFDPSRRRRHVLGVVSAALVLLGVACGSSKSSSSICPMRLEPQPGDSCSAAEGTRCNYVLVSSPCNAMDYLCSGGKWSVVTAMEAAAPACPTTPPRAGSPCSLTCAPYLCAFSVPTACAATTIARCDGRAWTVLCDDAGAADGGTEGAADAADAG